MTTDSARLPRQATCTVRSLSFRGIGLYNVSATGITARQPFVTTQSGGGRLVVTSSTDGGGTAHGSNTVSIDGTGSSIIATADGWSVRCGDRRMELGRGGTMTIDGVRYVPYRARARGKSPLWVPDCLLSKDGTLVSEPVAGSRACTGDGDGDGADAGEDTSFSFGAVAPVIEQVETTGAVNVTVDAAVLDRRTLSLDASGASRIRIANAAAAAVTLNRLSVGTAGAASVGDLPPAGHVTATASGASAVHGLRAILSFVASASGSATIRGTAATGASVSRKASGAASVLVSTQDTSQ